MGTTSPSEKLDVSGNINANQNAFCIKLIADEAISVGDVVVVSSSTDLRVVQSGISAGDEHVVGVAVSSATGAGRPVTIAVGGAVQVTVNNTVTRGDFLETGTVAGRVQSSGTAGGAGDFGIALESGTAGNLVWMIFKKTEVY
ncbi:MAG: hypothetical protein DRI94_13645 [Bacteroidetes bacterium]|nr:MAG: hypothetical protein DRI94_13645 [Bacteroidota bacterium]